MQMYFIHGEILRRKENISKFDANEFTSAQLTFFLQLSVRQFWSLFVKEYQDIDMLESLCLVVHNALNGFYCYFDTLY